MPYLSASRGTIFSDEEAPSENPFVYGFEVIAASGYVTALPDMIGFGSTKDMDQHYYNQETHSRVTIDFLKAGEEFLKEKDILLSDQLFLFGYSQGGFITLATHKELEEQSGYDKEIAAVAAGAGSYNIEFVMKDVLDRGVFTSPAFLSLIVYSYNLVNGFDKPMDYYFKEPYASQMPDLLNGSKDADEINNILPENLEELFDAGFMERMSDGTETEMINAFRENSVHNWFPDAVTRLYHSAGDEYIPIEDSQNTADLMSKGGADVTFVGLGDGDHSESAIAMLTKVIPWFESLRTDL
jgi:pimeloyl-ACP methyl ester carboxylesterase